MPTVYELIDAVPAEDRVILRKIAERARDLDAEVNGRKAGNIIDWVLDLTAAHARHPLRLQELLDADFSNFAHDVGGIRRHLDRASGELREHFTPRYAR